MKGISIKKGIKNSFHVEKISDFINFLNDNNIDGKVIKEYLKYHFADGSINGGGKKKITVEEYKKDHQGAIDNINYYINKEKK